MSRRVIQLSPQADRDLDQALAPMEPHHIEDAMRLLDAVERDAVHLAAMHGTGRKLETTNPAFGDVRSWHVIGYESWLLFYRPTQRGIQVLRLLQRPRDASAPAEP
jgi:toxin ParE1/3/4